MAGVGFRVEGLRFRVQGVAYRTLENRMKKKGDNEMDTVVIIGGVDKH